MSDEQKNPVDPKAVGQAFSQMIRDQRNLQRVRVTPATSRDSLNAALRVAGGHQPQHEEDEPLATPFPWKSLQPRDGDT